MRTDSDWAGVVSTREFYSGGYIRRNEGTVYHWSKTKSNVALHAEALNSAANGVSEVIGVLDALREFFIEDRIAM